MLNLTQIEDALRLLRCEVDNELYGLDMNWVRSIQRIDRLRWNQDDHPILNEGSVPEEATDHNLVGWLQSNKGDIPVYRLASKLKPTGTGASLPLAENRGSELQRIIILNPPLFSQDWNNSGEEGLWGLVVDRVLQAIQIKRDLIMPLPPIVINPAADYFNGVVRLDKQLILLLAPQRIHPDAQISSLGEHSQTSDNRGDIEEALLEKENRVSKPGRPVSNPISKVQKPGQIVMFTLQDQHPYEKGLSFGLSISQIPEILDDLPSIPVPSAPDFVLGLLNWRDRPVPLLDLPARLNLSTSPNPSSNGRSRILIVRDRSRNGTVPQLSDRRTLKNIYEEGVLGAFLIHPSIRILRLPIEHQPSSRKVPIRRKFIRGVVELEQETLLVPDIRTVLSRET